MTNISSLMGKKFGRLTVIGRLSNKPKDKWLCRCDCGKEVEVSFHNLMIGNTESCGCLIRSTLANKVEECSTSKEQLAEEAGISLEHLEKACGNQERLSFEDVVFLTRSLQEDTNPLEIALAHNYDYLALHGSYDDIVLLLQDAIKLTLDDSWDADRYLERENARAIRTWLLAMQSTVRSIVCRTLKNVFVRHNIQYWFGSSWERMFLDKENGKDLKKLDLAKSQSAIDK